jgi:signal transduction histidine kinase
MKEGVDSGRLAVLVHEVRSPVAALDAIARTLGEPDVDRPSRRELARLAIAACRAVERLVLDASLFSVRTGSVDPGRVAREAATAAVIGGARIETRIAPDLPSLVGDAVRLRQALDNLIENAIVHGGSQRAVVVAASVDVAEVRLSVSDGGRGIPEAEQSRIFEAGVRLDPAGSGSGLGLAIADAIVDAHGGRLFVESMPGEGTTFTIALPLQDSAQPATRTGRA